MNKSGQQQTLDRSLDANVREIRHRLGHSADLIIRKLEADSDGPAGEAAGNASVAVVYINGLADIKLVADFIVEPVRTDGASPASLRLNAFKQAIALGEVKETSTIEQVLTSILSGDTAVLIDGERSAITADTKGWKDRGITEPSSETVVRGPKEGFTETIVTNTAMIRRKIKHPDLRVERLTVGRYTLTEIAVIYLHGVADDNVVQEVRERLNRINVDAVLESGNVEELIQDETFTPFPTVYNTERPDIVASGIVEGRVAVLVDGTPFALLVPALFIQYFHASADHYDRADFATLLRILRLICFFIALFAPSVYIAITTFHQEVLPESLLLGLAAQREGVPFPAFVEALLMEITFEILREAGIRLPRTIGQSVSIVGTLVIGQAAVDAGLVSAAMVIVVAITAIANFAIPAFNMAITLRMLRFPIMGLAASFGLYGITVATLVMVLHLCSLRSFRVPYMSPLGPFVPADQDDALLRAPKWSNRQRPTFIGQRNPVREQTGEPKPPQSGMRRGERPR